mmetsp:Transcript_16983/g.36807  ORF Transcript_16983/g.36807 Transcript_16983/m.36807 type:complete len:386 (+) Transcript_16983:291-1448(+)
MVAFWPQQRRWNECHLLLHSRGGFPPEQVGADRRHRNLVGGTAMEPWMPADALASCGEATEDTHQKAKQAREVTGDPGLYVPGRHPAIELEQGPPSQHSTLWNSMVAPLTSLPVAAFYWYQGESNAGAPVPFAKCFPAMITSWRQHWTTSSKSSLAVDRPFIFFQLAPWPSLENGMIPAIRFAQLPALELPNVGIVVTADRGDAAGAFHPIHPPVKQELSRRAGMVTARLLYNDTAFPLQGPQVRSVTFDAWNPSWGDYHHGTGKGSYVCSPGSGFLCGGIRVEFDQKLTIAGCGGDGFTEPGDLNSFDSGLIVRDKVGGQNFQPVELTGALADDMTLQLNVTWVWGSTPPTVLQYALSDYPTMRIYNQFDQPAMPFQATIVPAE